MILVMVSNIANPFCAEVVKGIEEEAEKNGYRILLCNSGSDIERSRSGLSLGCRAKSSTALSPWTLLKAAGTGRADWLRTVGAVCRICRCRRGFLRGD